jgi:hypothetical protein
MHLDKFGGNRHCNTVSQIPQWATALTDPSKPSIFTQNLNFLRELSMNYFNTLNLRDKLKQLGTCDFLPREEFNDGVTALKA